MARLGCEWRVFLFRVVTTLSRELGRELRREGAAWGPENVHRFRMCNREGVT